MIDSLMSILCEVKWFITDWETVSINRAQNTACVSLGAGVLLWQAQEKGTTDAHQLFPVDALQGHLGMPFQNMTRSACARPQAHWGLLCMLSLYIVCAVGSELQIKARAKCLRLSGMRRSSLAIGGHDLASSPLRESIQAAV